MRILYLCHRLPYPPDKGDRLRAFHHLRQLGRRHDVHLVTLTDRRRDVRRAAPLAEHCRVVECFPRHRLAALLRCLMALPTGRPLTTAYFRTHALVSRLRALARQQSFDAVVAYCSSMAPYARMFHGLPRLLDLVDVDSAKWSQYARVAAFPRRPIFELEARRLRKLESDLHRGFDRVFVTTRREQLELSGICPEADVVVARNGVDLDAFDPRSRLAAARPTLTFVGQMDYFSNVDGVVRFARRVLPRLLDRFGDLELVVVGRSPAPAIRRLAELPGIRVTGEVDDVRPYLARAWVFVAPLRIAQGVQNKVLEAMAMGLPAVCSPRVALGLADGGLRAGRHLMVAADPQQWVEAILGLLGDEQLRQRMGRAARRQLERAYSWEGNARRFERQLVAVTRGRRLAAQPLERSRDLPAGGRRRGAAFGSPASRPAPAAAVEDPVNALSVDVEDYYQVTAFEGLVSRADWPAFRPRVDRNTRRLLDLFEQKGLRATFFTLGWVAERSPGLVREIHRRGHELAAHSWDHRSLQNQTPGQFRADARRSKAVLEDLTGDEVIGFRAPSYSIVRETLWAADILLDEGYRYDSSIFPIRHDRYGIPDAPRFPCCLRRHNGAALVEFPISTVRLLGANLPFVGGGYLRQLPWPYIQWGMRRVNQTENQPVVVYIHPWEIDPDQPRLPVGLMTRVRHYRNLDRAETRLAALCDEFRFAPVREVLEL